jgi:ribonuclease HII
VARKINPRQLKPDDEVSRATAKLRLLQRLKCTQKFEKQAWAVVAAAVILDPAYRIRGLRDSKLLPAARREVLAERIKQHCLAWAVAAVDSARIDQLNIYWASLEAMVEAIRQLDPAPDHLLLDAVRVQYDCPQTKIIHGDALSISIAAASIIAKVERDRMIRQWAPVFPAYDLASNKGYRSPRHLASLQQYGPTPLHRQSFAPVWMAASPQEVSDFLRQQGLPGEAESESDAAEALIAEELA